MTSSYTLTKTSGTRTFTLSELNALSFRLLSSGLSFQKSGSSMARFASVSIKRVGPPRLGILRGGTAPARAFAAFMKPAVANRPVVPFNTDVTLPDWQTEPDNEAYYGGPDNGSFVDQDGNPVEQGDGGAPERTGGEGGAPQPAPTASPERLDQEWINRVIGRGQPTPAPTGDGHRPALPPPAILSSPAPRRDSTTP